MLTSDSSPPAIGGESITIFRHLFESLAEEMGVTLTRAAFSPNIRERLDFSCALFDAQGHLVAQAAHIPVHLGSMPDLTMRLAEQTQYPGDVWLVNSPYEGGTHLPDLTLVAPLFEQGSRQRLGFAAARAHHADIGGMSPGSMPMSQEIFQEGLILPPVLLLRRGKRCQDIVRILLANVRTPAEREGDLLAQLSACRQAELRLADLEKRYGAEILRHSMSSLQLHSQRLTAQALEQLDHQGVWVEHQEFLEWASPGASEQHLLTLRVRLKIEGGLLHCDFRASDGAVPAPINAARPVTCAAVYYALLCFLGMEIPINQGVFRCVEVMTRPGSVLDAVSPAAVAAGNVETSQRVVDLVLGALGKLYPLPASAGSSMNNLTVGGIDPRRARSFTYYETAGGGYGGGPQRAGLSAAQVHMTNTRNTPAETLEREYPLRLWEYSIRRDSGGEGEHRGGDGLVREIEFLADVQATLLATRRTTAAPGNGGEDGRPGEDFHIQGGVRTPLSGQGTWKFPAGSRLRIETPGGGGWTQ